MKNLSPEICRQFGKIRRAKDISQSSLAAELGCKQPALSMFEAGDGTKLSEEVVRNLAARLGISLDQPPETEGDLAESACRGFCPNFQCPSNIPYLVAGRLLFGPSRNMSSPVPSARRCAICGEVLEHRCPTCGAPLNDGACCCVCGMPYVASLLPAGTDPVTWVENRCREIAALRGHIAP